MWRKGYAVALLHTAVCNVGIGISSFSSAFVSPTTTQQRRKAIKPTSPSTIDPYLTTSSRLLVSPQNDGDDSSAIAEEISATSEEMLDFDSLFADFEKINRDGIVSEGMTRLAQALNDSTDGWALTYADLHPETESTPAGIGFLATNLAYGLAGLMLAFQGDFFYGVLTDLAALVSFWYHYTQLKFGQGKSSIVRMALLMDYIVASATILTTAWYLSTGHTMDLIPPEGIVAGVLGTVSLGLCWVWEYGYPYIILHSLWHLFSAYAGYIVGQAHIQSTGGSLM